MPTSDLDEDTEGRVITLIVAKIWERGLAEIWARKMKIRKVLDGPKLCQV